MAEVSADNVSLVVLGVEESGRLESPLDWSVRPNPFDDRLNIACRLERAGTVTGRVYDAAGNLVGRLDAGNRSPGSHSLTWNAAALGPGVYFCELGVAGQTRTLRVVKAR